MTSLLRVCIALRVHDLACVAVICGAVVSIFIWSPQ